MSNILSAIHSYRSAAPNGNSNTFISFSDQLPIPAFCTKQKEEVLATFHITKEEYINVARCIYSLYVDSAFLAYYKNSSDEKTVHDFFFYDLQALVSAIMGTDFYVNDLFPDEYTLTDFETRCISIVQAKDTYPEDDFIYTFNLDKFTKIIEEYFDIIGSYVTTLSFNERKRRLDLRKTIKKISRLEQSVKKLGLAVYQQEVLLEKAIQQGDLKVIDKRNKALSNVQKDLLLCQENLASAIKRKEELESNELI